jgi:transcriptional regulator with XRE-family HTH domain
MPEKKLMNGTRQEQAVVVKTIGARMRQARELCNLSQSAAAKRLGYSNSSKLSKVEGATDTNSVPLWLILRAARVYEVSVDYLFGMTDDWEIGARMTQEREVSAWLFDAMEKSRLREMEILKKLHDRVEVMGETVAVICPAATDVGEALARFIELNPKFQDMRGGATLMKQVSRAAAAAAAAQGKLARFRVECSMAAADTPQHSLAL